MDKQTIIRKLQQLIETGQGFQSSRYGGDLHTKWERDINALIRNVFPTDKVHLEQIEDVSYAPYNWDDVKYNSEFQQLFVDGVGKVVAKLQSMADEVEQYYNEPIDSSSNQIQDNLPLSIIEKLCRRFDLVARPLRERRTNKTPFEIVDEYDVQDLLHGLLKIYFDDVRPEEPTPSYAGQGSKIDFLLPAEGIGIEVKHTKEYLRDGKVGEQLIVDIARYQSHPDCQTLVFFVYDPDKFLKNPHGIERNLNQNHKDFNVIVIINPK